MTPLGKHHEEQLNEAKEELKAYIDEQIARVEKMATKKGISDQESSSVRRMGTR